MKDNKMRGKIKTVLSTMMLVCCVFLTCGMDDCNSNTIVSEKPKHLSYIKDNRTGLCFAKYNEGGGDSYSPAITLVPCASLTKINPIEVEK